jgi:hypothetical protein
MCRTPTTATAEQPGQRQPGEGGAQRAAEAVRGELLARGPHSHGYIAVCSPGANGLRHTPPVG